MKIAYVEWPEGLVPGTGIWDAIRDSLRLAAPDILVTNEMPFGPWLAASAAFDRDQANDSVLRHEDGVHALAALGIPLVISSRPRWAGERLANEAFALRAGHYLPLHQKHYFPDEPGWYEAAWFQTAMPGFDVVALDGLRVGVLLCTEAMFNERARLYGLQGADLIAVPRATGESLDAWRTACEMAAVVSGSYVVSANRVGRQGDSPRFGGHGLAYMPGGGVIGETSTLCAMNTFILDVAKAREAKQHYPCYVFGKLSVPAAGRSTPHAY